MIEVTESDYSVYNCTVITPRGAVRGRVRVEGGIIVAVEEEPGPPRRNGAPGGRLIDAEGGYLTPGFVEMHIHGCGSAGAEEVLTGKRDVLEGMAVTLSRFGINTFVPTFPFHMDVMTRLAEELDRKPGLAGRIPGLYLEGPFVSPSKRGGIPPELLRAPDAGYLEEILSASKGSVLMMTVAPELEGSREIAARLLAEGIVPCLGHSAASAGEALGFREFLGIPSRRINITHLFNAMSPLSHKEPGLAAVPFLDDDIYFELNGDGIHIADEILRVCARHLNGERMILVSDAVVSAGEPYGKGEYFRRPIRSGPDGVRYVEDETLIGSNRLIHQAARHYRDVSGLGIEDVIPLVTANPFDLLNMPGGGRIEAGGPADLIVINRNFEVQVNLNPYHVNRII
ncbi:MAG: N-acetylglucosamine-6-phosphate deacetylase [Spirochaetia bacterium]